MTQGEVKIFETDAVIFPVKTEQEVSSNEQQSERVEISKNTFKIDINTRFARLRKSLKKRSASIL